MLNKQQYIIQPLISAVLILLVLFIFQKVTTGSFTNAPKRTFEVQGQGIVDVVPKTIQSSFSIQETGTTQADAQQKGNDKQDQATKLLLSLGFDKKDIKTDNYNVSPNYENTVQIYPPRPQPNTPNGYMITIDTQIQTTDINKMNKAIDQLTTLGVNVSGISYDTSPSDTNMYKDQARAKAIADAHQKAVSMAKAANFTLGDIQTIKDLDNMPNVYPGGPIMMKSEAAVGSVPSAPTNIQPGSDQVTSNISITYYIQ